MMIKTLAKELHPVFAVVKTLLDLSPPTTWEAALFLVKKAANNPDKITELNKLKGTSITPEAIFPAISDDSRKADNHAFAKGNKL